MPRRLPSPVQSPTGFSWVLPEKSHKTAKSQVAVRSFTGRRDLGGMSPGHIAVDCVEPRHYKEKSDEKMAARSESVGIGCKQRPTCRGRPSHGQGQHAAAGVHGA